MAEEREFIVTFGFGQLLEGCYTRVKAQNQGEVRDKMFDTYGAHWCIVYNSAEDAGVHRFNLKEVPFGTPNARVRDE